MKAARKTWSQKLPAGVQAQKEGDGFRVRLGRKFTGGEEIRKRFFDEGEARAWIKEQAKARDQIRSSQLTPSQLAAARRALDKLQGHGDLVEAAEYFVKHNPKPENTRRLAEAVETFLTAKRRKGLKPRSVQAYKDTLTTFAEDHPDQSIADIDKDDVTDWLDEDAWEKITILHHQVNLSVFFNWCVVQTWISRSPSKGIEKPSADNKPPGILTLAQLIKLLNTAVLNPKYQPLVPAIAIGAFAGLRTSEIRQLDWHEISLSQKIIEVTAAKSKTRQRRIVDAADNLLSFLEPFAQPEGRVWATNHWKLFVELREKIKLKWPKNALRHSFASYHLAFHQTPERTAYQLGHRDSKMLFECYRNLVTPAAAKVYWEIFPPDK